MVVKNPRSAIDAVDRLIVDELIVRRTESVSALASVYLRGTVLVALASTQVGIAVTLDARREVKFVIILLALISGLLGLKTFWPRKKKEFKPEVMRIHLLKQGENFLLSYQENLQAEYKEDHLLYIVFLGGMR
jgi:hypothetical protein